MPELPLSTADTFVFAPVYAESPGRILDQLDSLVSQKGVDLSRIEVVYVVNNGPDASERAREMNQQVLALGIYANGDVPPANARQRRIREVLTVVAVDAASPGREIPDCNVGRARQLGLDEITARATPEGDPLVVMTDADALFADPSFLRRTLETFDSRREVIGAAVGRRFVLSLDEGSDEEQRRVLERMPQFQINRHFGLLRQVIEKGYASGQDKFSGWGSVFRLRAANAVGGFPPIAMGEDVQLGRKLQQYARDHDQVTLDLKKQLVIQVAFRLSSRTDNSYTELFETLDPLVTETVTHPLTGQSVPLTTAVIEEMELAVAALPAGEPYVEYLRTGSSIAAIRW